jgi:tol-pal system protein YbgF
MFDVSVARCRLVMAVTVARMIGAVAAAVMVLTAPGGALAQTGETDPYIRIEQLEQQLRQLTGQNEELAHRNRMLEQQLQQSSGGQGAPAGAPPPAGGVGGVAAGQGALQGGPQGAPPLPAPAAGLAAPLPPPGGGQPPPATVYSPSAEIAGRGQGRGDAFDPAANPNAPGVPRALGTTPPTPPPAGVGAPGGRDAGEPLNLNHYGTSADQTTAPGGPAVSPPTQSPRDEFDLGIGYMQRRDYALAETTLRDFTRKYPSDALVADAQYWLGESMFQRQRYRNAAEVFLGVTTKYDRSAKAPDALLRLGQSLAALKEKEAACAALGEVTRKYPKASSGVRNGVAREQKRIGC